MASHQKPVSHEQGQLDGPEIYTGYIAVQSLHQYEGVVAERLDFGWVPIALGVLNRKVMYTKIVDQQGVFAIGGIVRKIHPDSGIGGLLPGLQQFFATRLDLTRGR
jgi:hypothetical protein